mmetsp:Transcript_21700/g.66870  ORF Transcript_21700/g.66870 Transcript_21700/m.66870 type:complete len:361 (+) Transcript_21700:245-1327(+)
MIVLAAGGTDGSVVGVEALPLAVAVVAELEKVEVEVGEGLRQPLANGTVDDAADVGCVEADEARTSSFEGVEVAEDEALEEVEAVEVVDEGNNPRLFEFVSDVANAELDERWTDVAESRREVACASRFVVLERSPRLTLGVEYRGAHVEPQRAETSEGRTQWCRNGFGVLQIEIRRHEAREERRELRAKEIDVDCVPTKDEGPKAFGVRESRREAPHRGAFGTAATQQDHGRRREALEVLALLDERQRLPLKRTLEVRHGAVGKRPQPSCEALREPRHRLLFKAVPADREALELLRSHCLEHLLPRRPRLRATLRLSPVVRQHFPHSSESQVSRHPIQIRVLLPGDNLQTPPALLSAPEL